MFKFYFIVFKYGYVNGIWTGGISLFQFSLVYARAFDPELDIPRQLLASRESSLKNGTKMKCVEDRALKDTPATVACVHCEVNDCA